MKAVIIWLSQLYIYIYISNLIYLDLNKSMILYLIALIIVLIAVYLYRMSCVVLCINLAKKKFLNTKNKGKCRSFLIKLKWK